VDKYLAISEELRSSIAPELDLIDSRIIGPVKELQGVLKMIRKSITKRDHKVSKNAPFFLSGLIILFKLQDYDRFNNSLTKLRDKKEKSLSDEKNLFKVGFLSLVCMYTYIYLYIFTPFQLEQDFEIATADYEDINNAMKTDLPQFMALATQFIDPLFQSYFYMQCV